MGKLEVKVLTNRVRIEGNTLKEIVRRMKEQDYSCPIQIRDYMHTVARRVRELYGKEVDTANVKAFLYSLEDAGMVQLIGVNRRKGGRCDAKAVGIS